MRRILHFVSVGLIIILFSDSCTIEKRRYMSGYNVDWKSSKNDKTKKEFVENEKQDKSKEIKSDPVAVTNKVNNESSLASSNTSDLYSTQITGKTIDSVSVAKDECDIIILKSGEEIKAKVSEISKNEIKYKKCEDLNGQTYSLKKSEVFEIKYPNGSKDLIAQETLAEKKTKPIEEEKSGVFGILSILFFGLGFIVPFLFIPSLIFAILGLEKNRKYRGFAIATLVLFGILTLLVFILLLTWDWE